MAANALPHNSIVQWNCRSLIHKRYKLKDLINVIQPLIICLQEVFYISDMELQALNDLFKNYFIYFKNRPRANVANPRGGVAILVNKSVPHQVLNLVTNLEAIAVNFTYSDSYQCLLTLLTK